MRAASALGPAGPLARAIDDYEHRPEQLAMAELVERTLEADGIALVEAGTGTGKTLSYLVPAILSGKRVVISTGTKTLQDQIMQRDLPLLESYLGVPFSSAVMKGLANYLCVRRYDEFMHGPEADQPQFARHVPLLQLFRAQTHSGERSELKLPETAPIWAEVQSGSDTRIGQRCQHFEACFVTRMRRRAEEAQIVVVNHHLFFADLALRGPHGAAAIPDYDAVIFDEAHQIEDVVTQFFGVRLSSTGLESLTRDSERAFRSSAGRDAAFALGRVVLACGSELFSSLPRAPLAEAGRRPVSEQQAVTSVRPQLFKLDAALEALYQHARLLSHESEAVAQVARRVHRLREDLALIVDVDRGHVLWMEARGKRSALGASPVEVGQILRERLFDAHKAVVLTSATLSTGGNFAFTKERLGIDFEVDALSLASPFDYARQAALYLPTHLPEPRDPAFAEKNS